MKVIKLFSLLLILLWGHVVYGASCTTIIPQLSTLSFGTITVQRDASPGTVLFSQHATLTGSYLTGCTNPLTLAFEMRYNGARLSSYGNHVYDTNIAGIGVRFSSGNHFDNPPTIFSYNAQASYVEWWGGKIELIVTGRPVSDSFKTGTLGVISLLGDDGLFHEGLTTNITGGSVSVLACSIKTPQLTFNIGDILTSKFSSTVGYIPPESEVSQDLQLECDADANINVKFIGAQNPDVSDNSVIALTGQGTAGVADGVGVQLVYNGQPLKINEKMVLKRSGGGLETFPVKARYYQTKTAITTGAANAAATLELTYQ